jgi:sugar/nucleoside kinase (ribokinase family)
VDEIDPTGAGDVFAAIFFCRLMLGDEPPIAARHANLHASASLNRVGLLAVPDAIEILDMGAVQT